MLKHVQLSPCRSRADSVSLSSSLSYSSLQSSNSPPGSSTSDSPPPLPLNSSSRSSSYTSLSESPPGPHMTTIKVYARCLRQDIEYKTLSISFANSSREVVQALLGKYRMRHRDPNLFYLTMEVAVRKAGIRTMLVLDDDARPAELQSCHPRGDSRFALQTRRGGLVKVYDSILMAGSQYKSLLISERTTVDELIQILLNCYNSKERVEQFSLYEVNFQDGVERKLHPDDRPLHVQQLWSSKRDMNFRLHRNPNCPQPRRKIGHVQWPCDLGLPPLHDISLSPPVRTYHQPSTTIALRERSSSCSQAIRRETSLLSLRREFMQGPQVVLRQYPPMLPSAQHQQQQQQQQQDRTSALLEDTIPQLRALQLTPVASSYTDYENYFYI